MPIELNTQITAPAFRFEKFGDKYEGTVISAREIQERDDNGELKFFPSNDPIMTWVITVEQENGEPGTFWAKGGKFKPARGKGESMKAAITTAVLAVGGKRVEEGAWLAVAYTGESERKEAKFSPAKLYTARYRPPAKGVALPVTPDEEPDDDDVDPFSDEDEPF